MNHLHPYQEHGYRWLEGKRMALLADEMGLGKSVQAIRALERIPHPERQRTLIVCPASVRPVWRYELKKWLFCDPERDLPAWTIRVVSYDEARLSADQLVKTYRPTTLILDESHYLKSPDAQRTKAILGKRGLAHLDTVNRIWCLSGTPAPNHAGEFYTLARTFGLTTLSHAGWCAAYCDMDRGIGGRPIGTSQRAIGPIRDLFSSVMLRRHKRDVLTELPDIWHQELPVDLDNDPPMEWLTPEEQADLKDRMADLRWELEAAVTGGGEGAFERLKALAPALSTLRRYIGLQKARPIARHLAEQMTTDPSAKFVVFGIHKGFLGYLESTLAPMGGVVKLDGSTSQKGREEAVRRFQEDSKCQVFLGQVIAAGTGITLTAAHRVILGEYSWVPGENLQAAMRCHRIGQEKTVTVQWVVGDDPLDRKVMSVLKGKAEELHHLLEEGKGTGSYADYSRIRKLG